MVEENSSLADSIDFIYEHLDGDLAVETVAKSVGYSLHHFCRIFSEKYGETPGAYIKKVRMEAALKELLEGKSVTVVSQKYGYKTLSGFYKAFSSVYGVGPRQKLAECRKEEVRIA